MNLAAASLRWDGIVLSFLNTCDIARRVYILSLAFSPKISVSLFLGLVDLSAYYASRFLECYQYRN